MIEVTVTDPGVRAVLALHDLARDVAHDDYLPSACACQRVGAAVVRRPPNTTGDVCVNCGGMSVRTGTCTTCTECGSQGGCG